LRSGTYWIALAVFTPNVATQGSIIATTMDSSTQNEEVSRLKRRVAGRIAPDAILKKETFVAVKSELSGDEVAIKDKLKLEVTE
jgi:hypothetical protein